MKCNNCKIELKDNLSIIAKNFDLTYVCDVCHGAIESSRATEVARKKRSWENHKIVGHQYAPYGGSGSCLEVLFDNGTGISVVSAGNGEYASSQRAPETQDCEMGIYAAVYAAKERHEMMYLWEYNQPRDCCGRFPALEYR